MSTDQHQCQTARRAIASGAVLALLLMPALVSCQQAVHPSPTATRQPSSTPLSETQTAPAMQPTLQPTLTSSDVPATLPTLTATPTPTPAPAASLARTRYTLAAHLDYARHHLDVWQTVAYVNSSPSSLFELLFVVEPNRQPGAFSLTGLTWADSQPIAGYALEEALLRVSLPAPLPPGQAITLSLSFELNLPARPAPFGYTPRQTNLGDWYPFVPPHDAEQGWLIHAPGVIGEHLVYDVADYRVDIALVGSETDANIAASGLARPTEQGQVQYQLDAARSFAWSAGREYHAISETVGTTQVVAYVFPEHRGAGETALRAVADALPVYCERFAPYPHVQLTMVESEFSDGMEYDGLFFLGQEYFAGYGGNPQDYLTAIAVHETAHQWWYGIVGNDQAIQPWLDETLATYSELLFYEAVYPDLTDWWWEFRVTRFNPGGWVDSTIYDHNGFRPYVNAVYLRGALFMQELRNLMGDEAFFSFLQDYVEQGRLGQMTATDFFDLLTTHTETDWSALFSRYFQTTSFFLPSRPSEWTNAAG